MDTLVLFAALGAAACSPAMPTPDGGTEDAGGDSSVDWSAPFSAGYTAMSNDPRSLQVSVSSESLGQQGFSYNASPAEGDIVFVDGWEVRFESIIVTLGNIRLNGPGSTPSDPSMVGAAVASEPRMFVVDAHKTGPLVGAGGAPETAIPLFAFDGATLSLDTTVRYAFSYDIVAASLAAHNVNLSTEQLDTYRMMLTKGWTHYVSGTATYRGTAAAAGSAFADYPTTVSFRLGFGAPASYINCNNPDNGGDDMPGVQPSATGRARAQLTLHMDHLFWTRLNVEDPPPHFDHFAARANMGVVTMDDLMGVAPTNLQDRMMRAVADRGGQTMGYTPMNADRLSLELNGASGIDDARSFVAFSARSQAHFNADGLCFVRPNGPLRF